jgi:hypothetical protein
VPSGVESRDFDLIKERYMKKFLLCLAASALMVAAPRAAETLKGTIGDSMCKAKHGGDEHAGKAKSDRDCVEKCINGGKDYVFVSGDKVYTIANQKFAGLKTHASHEVNLTGEIKGDTITVSKIEMPKAEPKK